MDRPTESNGAREPVSRLMITKMVLENFKSYAGAQEIGPFHKRFSSVVGPNGSGKSNVIDALLFVFGKRAKQLRLNKVSELIHKSSRFPDLEFARVSVYFQLILDDEESDDDFTVVPGSEFSVTRVAYQNNQSKYTVDAKHSTYTEVGQLLRTYGIDLDNNRFLILQGEVEQIAMMKPKAPSPHEEGLLEYLEDIIGSNKFVEQIEELSKVVDGLNEQRVEKINRLKIVEKEKDSLEGPMKDAQLFLQKEGDIRIHQNILYQYNIQQCTQNKDEATVNAEAIKSKLDYERNKLVETESRCSEMEKLYKTTNLEYDRLYEEMQRTAEEFTAYERRDTKMIEDLKHVQQQIKKLEAAIAKDVKKESECQVELEGCARKLASLASDIASASERKVEEEAALEEIMQGLSGATTALRAQLEEVQGRLADADRKVASLVTEKEGIEMSAQLIKSRADTAAKTLNANQNKLNQLTDERNGFIARMRSLESDSVAATAIVAQSEDEIAQLKVLETTIQGDIRTAVTNVEDAKAALQQGSSSGRSEVVDHLLKATKKGGPLAAAGVHGRLGDLGTIPQEYDLSVCLATGNMLDAVVVDSAEGAQRCVQYVRDKGRITCIVLKELKIDPSKMDGAPSGMPTGAQRLFDLITPVNAAVRPAFYTVLRDTLVVRDLDSAVSVAYEGGRAKWRVITLDGNLIDQSGTMSGGGKPTKSGGGMGPSRGGQGRAEGGITEQTVRNLEGEVLSAQARLQECRAALQDSTKSLKENKQKLKSCEIELEKIGMAVNLIDEQMSDISSRLSALQAEARLTADEQAQLAALERKIAELVHRIALASPDQATLQAEAKNLQQQILEIGGPKLKRAQAKVDAANETIATLTSTLSAAEVAESSARKQAGKANAARVKNEKELSKVTEKQSTLLAEQAEMEKEAEVVLVAQDQAKAAAEAHEIVLKNITKEHSALKEQVNCIRAAEAELTASFDDFSRILRENEEKLAVWTSHLDKIRQVHRNEIREQNSIAMSFSVPPASHGANEAMDVVGEDVEDETTSRSLVSDESGWTIRDEELPVLTNDQLPQAGSRRVDELKRDISVMEAELDRLKSDINLSAIEQYKEKLFVYRERMAELEAVTSERDVARKTFDECRKQRLDMFMHGFGIITLKLKEMYQMITLGGDAELELVDSLDPFSEGIVFSVRPPKKSWKNISNLSGGEKTLSSLALVFALHHYKPTPLYVMDEIDAALDFKNVSIVANYIKERTKNAQFVIISLRNNMFELADRLVGIYKTNDATKSITINPKLFESAVQGTRPPAARDENSVKAKSAVEMRTVFADTTNIKA